MRASMLLLADGRFPGGGHAHSGGVEAAVAAGSVFDLPSLERFLAGRLSTAGVSAAGLAAAACTLQHPWALLDAEADARTPSPAQRAASRALGRGLLRAARLAWPSSHLDTLAVEQPSPHHAIALGAASAAAGLSPAEAASVAAYGSVSGPASAGVRLLGLDPLAVAGIVASFDDRIEQIARAARPDDPLDLLPSPAGPLLEIGAELHAQWEVRLFAS